MSRVPTTLLTLISGIMILGSFINKPLPYDQKEALILQGVLNFIEAAHYQPKPIDDSLSVFVYDRFLESMDSGKRFLTAEEVASLSAHRLQIDEQVNAKTFEFFDEAIGYIDGSIPRAEKIFEKVIALPIDFASEEFIELDSDKKIYASGEAGLMEVWRKMVKYNVLTKVHSKIESQEAPDFDGEVKSLETLIQESTEKVKEDYERWFERLAKNRRSDRFEAYIGSITAYFDPHTSFFNPKEKADFDINMGGKLEGIGARLRSDGDFTRVDDIIPGGPAWKGKELEVDDVITMVRQEDEEEGLSIEGMRLDDVVQKIRGKKYTKVFLTVKKPDASIREITITRDVVDIDESKAKSLILNQEGLINNVGYIKLPKFYSSFEKEDGNSSAVDVAEEVKKLAAQNVNGIILDLRNNTGGSLSDVVDMSGIFIEDGPIVQVKPRGRDAYVYRDKDKSVLYDGPLIVMVNNVSASASEILAAALQDYGRAVIVGGTTFGKGTVQRFYDLDKAFNGSDEFKPLGNVKMTMQKFFRVNGGSTQLRGVEPDIHFPDNFTYTEYGEREYDNALEFSEIEPQPFHQDIVKLEHISEMARRSKERIATHPDFKLIEENALRLKESKEDSQYPLQLKAYTNLQEELDKESEKYKDLMKHAVTGFSTANLLVDMAKIEMDSSTIVKNQKWQEDIVKDIYLLETMNIMNDMIQLETSFAPIAARLAMTEPDIIKP